MKDNWQILHEKYDQYIGTLVIDYSWKVVLFEGLEDDIEDYYYKLYDWRTGESRASCVGMIIPLKGYLPENHYQYILGPWNLNSDRKAR